MSSSSLDWPAGERKQRDAATHIQHARRHRRGIERKKLTLELVLLDLDLVQMQARPAHTDTHKFNTPTQQRHSMRLTRNKAQQLTDLPRGRRRSTRLNWLVSTSFGTRVFTYSTRGTDRDTTTTIQGEDEIKDQE